MTKDNKVVFFPANEKIELSVIKRNLYFIITISELQDIAQELIKLGKSKSNKDKLIKVLGIALERYIGRLYRITKNEKATMEKLSEKEGAEIKEIIEWLKEIKKKEDDNGDQ